MAYKNALEKICRLCERHNKNSLSRSASKKA